MRLKSFLAPTLLAACSYFATAQRIAVLSDVHVTPGNKCDSALRAAVCEINSAPFDLVVMNGDLTNEGSDSELRHVKAILDRIGHPLAVVPGNHELNWSQSATKTFVDLWGDDRFVVDLDSLLVVGISCGPYMKMGDGHIKQEDLHWLRATLDRHPGKRILSFNHYPLQDDLDNHIEYINLLSDYPVIAHINGHYHTWRRYSGGDIPAMMTRALDLRDGTYGYAIIDINTDSIHVYNKNIGQSPTLVDAFAHGTGLRHVDTPARDWAQPDGFDIRQVWADSASVFTRLAFDHDNVYFGTSTGHAKAVAKDSGRLQWAIPTGASLFSRPAVLADGRVAYPGASAITIVSQGRVDTVIPSPDGPYVADPLVDANCWVQGAYKRLELRDNPSGRLIWVYDSIFNYCQAAPAIDGNDLIFGAWDTNLRCLDLDTGRLKWVWNNGKTANMLSPGNVVPVITPDRVYIVAPDRYMTAIDRHTGRTIWRDNSHEYRESLGTSTDKSRIYAKTMDGELVAVDATVAQFAELWTIDLGLGYEHAPCVILEQDGIVYAGSRRGILTAVDPATQTILWSIPLGVSEINGIDLDPATRSIWVSLIEGTIYRIQRVR